jgi:PAS domain S-box-containing protein
MDNLSGEQRVRFLSARFRHILHVVILIFIFAAVQMLALWRVGKTGMNTAMSLEHQGLPALNELASLQEHLAIYRLDSYEYLFAQETEKAARAKAADEIALQMRAELKNIQQHFPEGEGQQFAASLENAVADLDAQFQKVRQLVNSDFAAAMKSMDQDIPPRTQRVDAAADALKTFGYRFSGGQANATFASFGWIKSTAVMFGAANCLVAFGAIMFVLLAARRSRAELSHTLARLDERTGELSHERDLLKALLDHSPDPIYFKDAGSRFLKAGKVLAEKFGLKNVDELTGKTDFDFFAEEHARPSFEDEQGIIRTSQPLIGKVEKEVLKNGRVTWAITSKMSLRNKDNEIIGTFGISKDITVIKETEAKLEQVHKKLLDTSRQAGMSEIATNILHNVGNVLNSVNISGSLLAESVKQSRISSLAKVAALMQEHEHDLGTFITSDSKGKRLPSYLANLSENLLAEQKMNIQELDSLMKNIQHIKEVVAMQQNYAKVSGVKEIINPQELVEDALRMNVDSLDRHQMKLVREFQAVPLINIDKHQVLQVLVNLIRNAKHACEDSERLDKQITARVAHADGRIKISISDNGIGIPSENLTRIFNHGFTTRANGHGFGLHSGALAAKQMGGALIAHSDGPGQGATFTLELPSSANEDSASAFEKKVVAVSG